MFLFSGIFLMGNSLFAQQMETGNFTETIISPQFFITVIAGVILALGFQFILTALSVAAGISAVGDVKKSYVENKNHTSGKHQFNEESDSDNGHSAGSLVTTGLGIWSTLTVAISLFGATAFAMNLSLVASPLIGVTLALVIWATFFILLFYLESKVVNTLIGGLINTATAGLRSSAATVKNMFAPSKEDKIENIADHTVEKVREEFQNSFDSDMIDSAIDEFFTKFDKRTPNYDQVKQDIEKLVDESVEKSNEATQDINVDNSNSSSGNSHAKWMTIQSVLNNAIDQSSQEDSSEGESKTKQLKELKAKLQDIYNKDASNEANAKNIVAEFTSADKEQVDSYLKKIKDFVSQDSSVDMDSAEMEQRVKEMLKNPKVEANKISAKMGELDRDSIVVMLSNNTDLDREKVEIYADKVEKILRRIQVQLNQSSQQQSVNKILNQVQETVNSLGSGNSGNNLDFSQLSKILQNKMDNRKDDLSVVKSRIANTDKDEIMALVTNNTKIDKKDIDKVVQSYEHAKSTVERKIRKVEDTAQAKLKTMERKAVIKAEHARETAAAAAWWLVVSAAFSACAAIGGSMLTIF
jgi:hypothetical protein